MAAVLYRIVVGGHLGPRYRSEFGELEIDAGEHETVLSGPIVDQAQLQGLLDRIAALNLVLVSVNRFDPSGGDPVPARRSAA